MPTVQLSLDSSVSAMLSYLAEISGRRRPELLEEYVRQVVAEKFREASQNAGAPPAAPANPARSRGRRGQPVRYDGDDPRLTTGFEYSSYAHVLRTLGRPDYEAKLYDPKAHKGDNAESILQRYESDIHRSLVRV